MGHNRTLPLSSKPCSHTPLKVQGIMRLAVKYEVETIRGTILKHVESEWPHTLEEWERRHNEREGERMVVSDPALDDEEENYPDPALAVRFGLEFDCPKILPAAFYDLATAYGPRPWPGTWDPSITWNCLQAADLIEVIAGQKALAFKSMGISRKKWGCSCEQCSQVVQACVSQALRQSDIFNPLIVLRLFHDRISSRQSTDFCRPAISSLVIPGETRTMAEELWQELPFLFNLPKPDMSDG